MSDQKTQINNRVEELSRKYLDVISVFEAEILEDWKDKWKKIFGDDFDLDCLSRVVEANVRAIFLSDILAEEVGAVGGWDNLDQVSLEFRVAFQQIFSDVYIAIGEITGREKFCQFFGMCPEDAGLWMLLLMMTRHTWDID